MTVVARKKMSGPKNVIIVSQNEGLYRTIKRACAFLDGIKCAHSNIYPEMVRENDVLLIDATETKSLLSDIIGLRMRMTLCPAIVFTHQDTGDDNNQSVYRGSAITYYPIPFDLNELRDSIKYSETISKEENINNLMEWLANAHSFIEHKLRSPEGRIVMKSFLDNIAVSFKDKNLQKQTTKIKVMLIKSSEDTNKVTTLIMEVVDSIKHLICKLSGGKS